MALTFGCFLLSACGQGEADPTDNGSQNNPDPSVERQLAVVGSALVQVETGGRAELVVGLAEEDVGVVGGELVEFSIVGSGRGSGLTEEERETASVITNEAGLASVDLFAGDEPTTFQVTAVSPSSNQVAFAVHVVQLQHRIAIVRTPSVRVDPSGTEATVDSGAGNRVLLRVRITDQFARPIPEVSVNYSFEGSGPQSARFEDGKSEALTNPGGEAQIALETGAELEDTFTVRAQTAHSTRVHWTVNLQADQSRLCKTDEDCGPGFYCRNDMCVGSASCSVEEPIVECPPGYICVVNECHPSADIGCVDDDDCGPGFECIDGVCVPTDPECEDDDDCPPGFYCRGGICVADPDAEVPDVSGGWYTAHVFDISDMLGFGGGLAGPVREIHRILTGNIGLPWPFDDLIESIVDQFIPPWVTTLIAILDTILTFTNELRAEGYMSIEQSGSSFLGSEVWDSFVFYYLPMCSTIPSDPTPDCARVDLFVDDVGDDISLGLAVHPFSGSVGEIGDDNTALMLVNTRKVDLNIAGLIRWLIDEVVRMLTPHNDLESAIQAAVDCASLGVSIENMTNGLVNRSFVESACITVLDGMLDDILDSLFGGTVGWGILEFHGQSTVHEISPHGNYADQLGYPDYEEREDGIWRGTSGAWHGSRRPIQ